MEYIYNYVFCILTRHFCCHRLARQEREHEEVAAQQDAAMQAVQSRARHRNEPSPLAQLDIGHFFRKLVGILTRYRNSM